jgi:UDP-3-O-[3-hydroxymyristoyl] glucosamine N-acyltransferase
LPCKVIIGHGSALAAALEAWRASAPSLELRAVPIDAGADAAAVAAALDGPDGFKAGSVGDSVFVAVDAAFLNFHRLAAVEAARVLGLPMQPLVCTGAIVSAGVVIGDNCLIGAGAIIGHGCRIGANAVIGAGAVLAAGVSIGESAWLDEGVVVGSGADIGAHTRLGLGVTVNHGVRIGALAIVDKPGRVDADVAARTYVLATHATPLVIVGS